MEISKIRIGYRNNFVIQNSSSSAVYLNHKANRERKSQLTYQDIRKEIRTSTSSFWHVMLQYFAFISKLLSIEYVYYPWCCLLYLPVLIDWVSLGSIGSFSQLSELYSDQGEVGTDVTRIITWHVTQTIVTWRWLIYTCSSSLSPI